MGRKRAPGSTTPQWVYTNDSIVAALQATYPVICKGRFLEALMEAFPDYAIDASRFTRVPDAYAIRVDDREVDLFEVEVTHPLPVHTLRDIAKLWFELDGLSIRLSLYVVSRYGHINAVALQPWYYELNHVAADRRPVPPDLQEALLGAAAGAGPNGDLVQPDR